MAVSGTTAPFNLRRTPRFAWLAMGAVALAGAGAHGQFGVCTTGTAQIDQADALQGATLGSAFTNTVSGVENGVGQVFQAGITGILDDVVVVLRDLTPGGGTPIKPRMDLYVATSGAGPQSTQWIPIGSYPGTPNAPTAAKGPYVFRFKGVTIQAGNYYALVVTGQGATQTNKLALFGSNTNSYPAGQFFTSTNSVPGQPTDPSLNFAVPPNSNKDLAFQTCVTPTPPASPACGGRVWTQANVCGALGVPSGRSGHCMAYDYNLGGVLMFGGSPTHNVNSTLKDTWLWKNHTWTNLNPVTKPSTRTRAAMAWDPKRNTIVLFGGERISGVLGDTWEWNSMSMNWATVSVGGVKPSIRSGHTMTTDWSTNGIVLIGGGSGASDEWAWNGNAAPAQRWKQVVIPWCGMSRIGHGAAFSTTPSIGGAVIMFGGFDNCAGLLTNDTFAFTPLARLVLPTSPTPRQWPGTTTDLSSDQIVMFGGEAGGGLDETWVWDDPNGWMQVAQGAAPRPQALWGTALAYDVADDEIVLFGGVPAAGCPNDSNETWYAPRCMADYDQDWEPATNSDALALQNGMANGDPCIGDCNFDGVLDLFDVVCILSTPCP